MKRPLRRSRPLMTLLGLELMTGLFGILSLLLFPPLLLKENGVLVDSRPVVSVAIISVFAIMNIVVAVGLWMREQWAFRLGLLFSVMTIAISLFGVFVFFSEHVLDGDPIIAVILNGILLSFFLRPDVAASLKRLE